VSNNEKILLVDDDKDIALSFKLALQYEGFFVEVFNSSTEALVNFKPNLYKLALIDLKMPEMNGIELFNKIRDKDKIIKICFITAYDWDNQEVKEFTDCFIKKPITINGLIKIVRKEIECNCTF
jgi:two-component system response regulator ChvI